MQNRKQFRGFTLIELLVVIAIIGILSGVVLVSLSTTKKKGNDAAVQSDLRNAATQAEIVRGLQDCYGDGVTASCTHAAIKLACDGVGGALGMTQTIFGNSKVQAQIQQALDLSGGLSRCVEAANDVSWGAIVQLASDPLKAFCVDSFGYRGTITFLGTPSPSDMNAHISTVAGKCIP